MYVQAGLLLMGKQRNGASRGDSELRLAVIPRAMHAAPKVARTSALRGHRRGKCLEQDHTVDTVLKTVIQVRLLRWSWTSLLWRWCLNLGDYSSRQMWPWVELGDGGWTFGMDQKCPHSLAAFPLSTSLLRLFFLFLTN